MGAVSVPVPLESSLDPTGQNGWWRGKPIPGVRKGLAAGQGDPRPIPAMTLLDLRSLRTAGMCRRVGIRRGRALALG